MPGWQAEPEPQQSDYPSFAAYQTARDAWATRDANRRVSWQERMRHLPSQGLVLVEMHWMHDLLINFPFLRPFLGVFGDTENIVISVWAAFPVPAADPNITYGLPPE